MSNPQPESRWLKQGHRSSDPVILRAEDLTWRADQMARKAIIKSWWAIGISVAALLINVARLVQILVRHYA